jgi:hypothetical protein
MPYDRKTHGAPHVSRRSDVVRQATIRGRRDIKEKAASGNAAFGQGRPPIDGGR